MDWYVLRTRRDALVAQDLRDAGVSVEMLQYTVEFWHSRKSVVVTRQHSLLPGHLLVGEPRLPAHATRHWCRYMTDRASGAPLRAPEADALIERCDRGEFDVRRESRTPFSEGDRVFVEFLGVLGSILSCARGMCRVMLDMGHTVTVGQMGLSLV